MSESSSSVLPFTVDAGETVAELPDLLVSEITIAPGQEVPWHYHSNVTDTFYCLSGCTSVRYGVTGHATLSPGESVAVAAGTPHQVSSGADSTCRFLIVQGIGTYDFVPTAQPEGRVDE